jgi:ornithine decarboxylase
MDQKTLLQLAKNHGTPFVVVDHKVLRENYELFRKYLPRVQVYYAVKANSDPAIVQTFYNAGASFDVASMAEFLNVHEKIKHLPATQQQDFIWDRIIYANPIKAIETLEQLNPYKPLVTYDNHEEVIRSPAMRRTQA